MGCKSVYPEPTHFWAISTALPNSALGISHWASAAPPPRSAGWHHQTPPSVPPHQPEEAEVPAWLGLHFFYYFKFWSKAALLLQAFSGGRSGGHPPALVASLAAEHGLSSTQASVHGLRSVGSLAGTCSLVSPQHMRSSSLRDRTQSLLGKEILNYWRTSEAWPLFEQPQGPVQPGGTHEDLPWLIRSGWHGGGQVAGARPYWRDLGFPDDSVGKESTCDVRRGI